MRGRDQLALVALALTLALTGALTGGTERWTACLAAGLAVVTAAAYVTSRRRASAVGPLLVLLGAAAGATAFALLPLPEPIAEQVAAAKLALVRDHASALDERAPTWIVASHDPPATLVELAKLLGYLAMAWTATRLTAERRARPWVAAAVVGTAAAVVLIAAVHEALGARALYGVFRTPIATRAASPLVNVNHLAALAALAVPLALGLAVHWRGGKRVAALGATLVLVAATLLTGSRGGALGLGAGILVAVVLLVAQRRVGVDDSSRRIPAGVALSTALVAGCAVVLLGLVAGGGVARELESTSLAELREPRSKFQIWGESWPLVDENRWLGIGRGSFETAFARHNPIGDTTYSHVENTYLQALIDWGFPAATLLGLGLLALGRVAVRRWRHGPVEAGALGALAAVAVHDLADFSLEVPVIAMCAVAAAALLVPARTGTSADRAPVPRRTVARRALALVGGIAVIALAATPLGRTARADREHLRAAASPEAQLAAARAVLDRHPSDGLAAGHAAQALFARRDPRAVAVIGRALYLMPLHPGLHQLAARMLFESQRPEQAQLELRLALTWTRDIEPVLDDVFRMFTDAERAAACLPTDPRQVWRLHAALVRRKRTDVSLAYLLRVDARPTTTPEVQVLLSQVAVTQGRADVALAAAERAHAARPTARSAAALGQALALNQQPARAAAVLRAAPPPTDAYQRRTIALLLSQVLSSQGDLGAAHAVLTEAAERLEGHPLDEAVLRDALAALDDRLGNRSQAAWQRERADRLRQP